MKLNTVKELYKIGVQTLLEAKVDTPQIDARAILEHVLGIDFGKLPLYFEHDCKHVCDEYLAKINERCFSKPLSYITNKKEFYSRDFFVKEGVLIPRPETENLVDAVLKRIAHYNRPCIADICSGSGCIGITLALETSANVDMYELSDAAIEISKMNIERLCAQNTAIYKKNIITENIEKKYDIIVSNPPYIPEIEIETLMNDVKDYEPKMALTDGKDGFSFYVRLCEIAKTVLNENGILAVEVGLNQHNIVKNIFENYLKETEIHSDYFGIERVVLGSQI